MHQVGFHYTDRYNIALEFSEKRCENKRLFHFVKVAHKIECLLLGNVLEMRR